MLRYNTYGETGEEMFRFPRDTRLTVRPKNPCCRSRLDDGGPCALYEGDVTMRSPLTTDRLEDPYFL